MLCSHAILALARALTQFTCCAGTIVPILKYKYWWGKVDFALLTDAMLALAQVFSVYLLY